MTTAEEQAAILAATLKVVKRDLLSPMLVGCFLSFTLCGILLSLSFQYFTRFPKDRLAYKALVAFLTVAAIADTAILGSWNYNNLVTGFDDYTVATAYPWQLTSYAAYTGPFVGVCTTFFAYRVLVVSGYSREGYAIAAVAGALIAASIVCTSYMAWYHQTHSTLLSDFAKTEGWAWAWLALEMTGDTLITASLYYFLSWKPRHNRRQNDFFVQQSPLMRLVVQAFATNLMSALLQAATIGLIAYSFDKGSLHYAIVGNQESKMYGVSVIISLLSRRSTSSGGAYNPSSNDTPLPLDTHNKGGIPLSKRSPNGHGTLGYGGGGQQSVHVRIEEDVRVEEHPDLYTAEFARQDHNPYAGAAKVSFNGDEASLEEKGIRY